MKQKNEKLIRILAHPHSLLPPPSSPPHSHTYSHSIHHFVRTLEPHDTQRHGNDRRSTHTILNTRANHFRFIFFRELEEPNAFQ